MPTRFYLPSSGPSPVSPAFEAAWEDTTLAIRLRTGPIKHDSVMTTVSFSDVDATDRDILLRQYISDPIEVQTLTIPEIEFQVRGLQPALLGRMFTAIAIRVITPTDALRGTIVTVTRDNFQLTDIGTLTNRRLLATGSTVVCVAGDRIVIEIGTGGDPDVGFNHNSSLRLGDSSASDLPEDNTSTDDFNPWVELSTTVIFQSIGWDIPQQPTPLPRKRHAAEGALLIVPIPPVIPPVAEPITVPSVQLDTTVLRRPDSSVVY